MHTHRRTIFSSRASLVLYVEHDRTCISYNGLSLLGSTQIGSAAISWNSTTGTFTFANLNYTIPANTTQALTVKEDIKSADATAVTQSTVISANGVNAENSQGSTLSSTYLTGSATGNNLIVLKQGPIFSLVGSPTIQTSGVPEKCTVLNQHQLHS